MRTLLFMLLFSSFAFVASANNGPGRPDPELSGGVVDADSKRPLANVSVIIISHDTKEKKLATTDGNGTYSFNDVRAGNYKIVFQREGYKKITRDKVYLREDDNLQLNMEMLEAEDDFQLIPNIILSLVGTDDNP